MAVIDFALPCVHCATPLTGVPLDGACPTCRKPIADTLELDAIDLGTATVSADVLCPRCGYNLRSLGIAAPCPECNQAVSHALHRNILGLANPDWRKRVLRGIHQLLLVMAGIPVSIIVILFLIHVGPNVSPFVAGLLSLPVHLTLSVVLMMGIFGVSTQDRQATGPPTSAWPRFIARAAILLAAILIVGSRAMLYLGATVIPHTTTLWATDTISSSVKVIGLISLIAVGFCFRQIARRARDESLIKRTNTWLALFALVILASTLPGVFGMPTQGIIFIPPGIARLGVAAHIFATIVGLILYVQTIIGLFAYRRLLRGAEPAAPLNHPIHTP